MIPDDSSVVSREHYFPKTVNLDDVQGRGTVRKD